MLEEREAAASSAGAACKAGSGQMLALCSLSSLTFGCSQTLRVSQCMTCPAKYVCATKGQQFWMREARRRAAAVAFALVNSWPSPLGMRLRSLPQNACHDILLVPHKQLRILELVGKCSLLFKG